MQIQDLTDIVAALPQARAISNEEAYWRNVVPKLVPQVLDEIVMAHDWDFAGNDYSSVVTVADQSDYDVRGEDNDCRDIISIRYDSDKLLLTHFRTADMDEIVSNDQAPSEVFGWTQYKRTRDGYPTITLHTTPGTAGKALYIRYRLKDVPLNKYPDDFGYVIALGVLAWMDERRRYTFEKKLRKMIRQYKRGGKDTQITSINPRSVRANNDIADLYGTG